MRSGTHIGFAHSKGLELFTSQWKPCPHSKLQTGVTLVQITCFGTQVAVWHELRVAGVILHSYPGSHGVVHSVGAQKHCKGPLGSSVIGGLRAKMAGAKNNAESN